MHFELNQCKNIYVFLQICGKQWKWYDVSTSKWCAYNAPYNKIINDAYWSGETCVRISYGRRKYTLQFSCMYQVRFQNTTTKIKRLINRF
jgi:hypothetical protein